jgi:hypothetical protein
MSRRGVDLAPGPVETELPAERGLLGAALHDPAALPAVLSVSPAEFHTDKNRHIREAIGSLVSAGSGVDLITLEAEFRRRGRLEDVGGRAYLAVLFEEGTVATLAPDYARLVRRAAFRRRLAFGARALVVKALQNGEGPPAEALLQELDQLRAELAPLAASGESEPTRGGLPFTRLGDLLLEPEEAVSWLVEKRLPTGGLSLLAGKPKVGKSTLTRSLALAVVRGEPWLGLRTAPGPVLYLALEEKRAEVRRHFEAMGAVEEDVRLFVAPSPQDGLPRLRAAAEQERPALIIVDPLLRFVRVRDANDYAAVTQALEPLMALARDTGAHVLAVHHLGKLDRAGGDGILGSTAFYAAVDTALLLRRTEHYRTLSSIQRYGEDLEEVTLALDPQTRRVSAGPSRRDADETKAAAAIQEHLAGQDEPVEASAIHEGVEGRKVVKQRALAALVAVGRVSRSGAGKKGDPYRYRLATPDSGFPAPSYIGEQENQKPKTTVTPHEDAPDSSSSENHASGATSEIRESEIQAPAGIPQEVLEL